MPLPAATTPPISARPCVRAGSECRGAPQVSARGGVGAGTPERSETRRALDAAVEKRSQWQSAPDQRTAEAVAFSCRGGCACCGRSGDFFFFFFCHTVNEMACGCCNNTAEVRMEKLQKENTTRVSPKMSKSENLLTRSVHRLLHSVATSAHARHPARRLALQPEGMHLSLGWPTVFFFFFFFFFFGRAYRSEDTAARTPQRGHRSEDTWLRATSLQKLPLAICPVRTVSRAQF